MILLTINAVMQMVEHQFGIILSSRITGTMRENIPSSCLMVFKYVPDFGSILLPNVPIISIGIPMPKPIRYKFMPPETRFPCCIVYNRDADTGAVVQGEHTNDVIIPIIKAPSFE